MSYKKKLKFCQTCRRRIPKDRPHFKTLRFCCRKCKDIAWRRPKRFCITCNTLLIRYMKKYCSLNCKHIYEWRKKKQIIESTQSISKTTSCNKTARKYLMEIHGKTCSICKRWSWNKIGIPLVLDHIDGNSDNWKLSNLRLVCPNCDAQLPTFKGRNRGHGRHSRRERYREGKSY